MPDTPEQAWQYAVKSHLRKHIGTMRKLLPEEVRKVRSKAICDRVVGTSYFERARTVVGYIALGKEVDPAEILEVAYTSGKTLGLPRVDTQTGLLSLHRWAPGEPLEKGQLGASEPLASAQRLEYSEVDLIVVPALAIDPRGQRLGRGGGYYDRLLAFFSDTFAFGIIYDFQLVVEAPVTTGDMPVAAVATDRRLVIVESTPKDGIG